MVTVCTGMFLTLVKDSMYGDLFTMISSVMANNCVHQTREPSPRAGDAARWAS